MIATTEKTPVMAVTENVIFDKNEANKQTTKDIAVSIAENVIFLISTLLISNNHISSQHT